VAASQTAMQEVAASQTAMTTLLSNDTQIESVMANTVINSSTATSEFEASPLNEEESGFFNSQNSSAAGTTITNSRMLVTSNNESSNNNPGLDYQRVGVAYSIEYGQHGNSNTTFVINQAVIDENGNWTGNPGSFDIQGIKK